MKTALLSVLAVLAAGTAADCTANNCLRALRAPQRLEAAQAFCSTFTTAPVTATAAIPSFAVDACKDNQNGPLTARVSSACSCIATSTSTNTTPTPTASPTEPCAVVSSSWASQSAAGVATPTVAAALAYDCLNSVPLHKDDALALVEAMEPYVEWQSDAGFKADPPPEYFWPPYDIFGTIEKIKENLRTGVYKNEYSFHTDMYASLFGRGHDGHWVFYSDLLSRAFDFNRQRALVSISEDGIALPVIKIYEDVISSPSTASEVTHINGVEASKFVEDVIYKVTYNQDPDAAYNSMFYEKAYVAAGSGNGFFRSGGRIRYVYQGPNTTFTFANGTEVTFQNYARIKESFAGVANGQAMYTKFCSPRGTTAEAAAIAPAAVVGYPPSVVSTSDDVVSCYFLDGPGYEDVAVISLLAFASDSPAEFQSVCQECFSRAIAAGKKKLIIDFQANGGGYILLGYDFFRQLFPQVVQDGFSRWKENVGFNTISRIISDKVEGLNPYTSDDEALVEAWGTWFNWRHDYDVDNKNFTSYEDKFDPHVYKNTPYTDIMRWNLDDPLETVNETFGIGIEITGYGALKNVTQPFAPENIIMLYDGGCASTCTLASEFLRLQGGVKSVAFGGRPQRGPIDGVGGVKGAQTLSYSTVQAYAQFVRPWATTDAQRAALDRYTSLPLQRSTAASLNTRDQILRPNLEDGTPAQFVREEADCRLFWTEAQIKDVSAVWKATADVAFNGGKCAHGGISRPKGSDIDEKAAKLASNFVPAKPRKGSDFRTAGKQHLSPEEEQMWLEKHLQRVVV